MGNTGCWQHWSGLGSSFSALWYFTGDVGPRGNFCCHSAVGFERLRECNYLAFSPTALWCDLVSFTQALVHYGDVIMGVLASQITSLTIVYSTVHSGADQRKHQSSVSLAFVGRIHRWLVNSPHKWPVTRKMIPFDDVIMQFTGINTAFKHSTILHSKKKDSLISLNETCSLKVFEFTFVFLNMESIFHKDVCVKILTLTIHLNISSSSAIFLLVMRIDRIARVLSYNHNPPPRGNASGFNTTAQIKLILRNCFHGPLTRYVKLWVPHAPGMFFPPPNSKETAS